MSGSQEVDELNLGELRGLVGFHLRRSYSRFSRLYAEFLSPHLLKAQQYSILVLVENNKGIRASQIAELLEIKKPLLVILIEDLEKREFIRRERPIHDRRQQCITITKEGKRFLARIKKVQLKMNDQLTENLTPKELETLNHLLEKIYMD